MVVSPLLEDLVNCRGSSFRQHTHQFWQIASQEGDFFSKVTTIRQETFHHIETFNAVKRR